MIPSPCIKVCRVADGVCVGCGRTLDEITRWSRMDDDERAAVLARVEEEKGEDMSEERAPYNGWPMRNLVEMLQQLGRHEHTDVSIAHDAALEIRRLRRGIRVLLEALDNAVEALDSDNPDIQLRAAVAARAVIAKAKGESV